MKFDKRWVIPDTSPYFGLGVAENVTQAAAIVGQWNRNRGNGSTGSTDLLSLGVTVLLA